MLTLSGAMAARMADDPYLACHLIQLDGSTVHRWTDAPIDVTWNGFTWLHSTPFTIGNIVTDANGEQLVSFVFDEQAQQLQGFDLSEGMADRTITVWELCVNPATGAVADAVIICGPGTTQGIDFDETGQTSTGTLSVTPSYAGVGQSGPSNVYQLSCINGYKDARCKYAGVIADCDHTYNGGNGCVTHANQKNFRGCRHAIEGPKLITWGGGTVFIPAAGERPPNPYENGGIAPVDLGHGYSPMPHETPPSSTT